jgi:nicotinamidase-related amidase
VVIRKPSYGAFYDTPLDTILRGLGKDTMIVTGTLTNYSCGTHLGHGRTLDHGSASSTGEWRRCRR